MEVDTGSPRLGAPRGFIQNGVGGSCLASAFVFSVVDRTRHGVPRGAADLLVLTALQSGMGGPGIPLTGSFGFFVLHQSPGDNENLCGELWSHQDCVSLLLCAELTLPPRPPPPSSPARIKRVVPSPARRCVAVPLAVMTNLGWDTVPLWAMWAYSQNPLIAVFPILADAVDVKRGDQLCETVFQPSIQPDKVIRPMGS